MSAIHKSPLRAIDSEHMSAWLNLRRQLEDRITDEETRSLLHDFIQLHLDICEEEANDSFWKGVGAGISIVMEKEERERRAALKLYRKVAQDAENKSAKSTAKGIAKRVKKKRRMRRINAIHKHKNPFSIKGKGIFFL